MTVYRRGWTDNRSVGEKISQARQSQRRGEGTDRTGYWRSRSGSRGQSGRQTRGDPQRADVRLVLVVVKELFDLSQTMLDVVPPELPDFVEHLVLDLVTRERLVGEVVVGRSFGLDDGGRGRKGGVCVGVGVMVKDVLDGLQWKREGSERGQVCESEEVGREGEKGAKEQMD